MTVGRLTDRLQNDIDFVSVARLYSGEDAELLDALKDIPDAEHVPFRHRRAELDRAFAERLAAWSAASAEPERLLLAETLLRRSRVRSPNAPHPWSSWSTA
ncbi:hypothetical protein LUW76_37595 [Actinomadura madurae]|uniref:hypothetical protein n=1 Tax=Actinomadura madurae TaxID=1993 RepID=UPI0020265309|nr:hypothetical protein [Actinomadura madurae]URM99573.1 hypothetical protein LUW76_37595 [Actinomadura madurae]